MTYAEKLLYNLGYVKSDSRENECRYLKFLGSGSLILEILFDVDSHEVILSDNFSISGDKHLSMDTLGAITERAKELGFIGEVNMFNITGDAYGEVVLKSDVDLDSLSKISLLAFDIVTDDIDDRRYLLYLKDTSINLENVSKDLELLSNYISSGYVKFNNLENSEMWETDFVNDNWTPISPKK